MYKISVICPVYNCEEKISRTINSIINQTIGFENIELILVDDCSSDSSVEIIEDFCSKYENIKLYRSNVNHGFPGYGRNEGINKANADYIMFIDNDDEYCPKFCEIAYDAIVSFDSDVISFNHLVIQKDKVKKINTFAEIESINENNIKKIDLSDFYYFKSPFIWTKIFKKSVIIDNNVRFVEDRMGEDVLFLYDFYYYANSLICIDDYGYKWYRDGDNLSYFSIKATLGILNSYYDICESVESKYNKIDYDKIFKNSIEGTIIRICMSFNKISEIKPLIRELNHFERHINFKGSLNYFWSTTINFFILKNIFSIAIGLIYIVRKTKNVYDRFS